MSLLSDLIGGLKTRQSEIALSLAAGNASNWETYQRMVGHHAGLQEALHIIDSLLKEDDDDR